MFKNIDDYLQYKEVDLHKVMTIYIYENYLKMFSLKNKLKKN